MQHIFVLKKIFLLFVIVVFSASYNLFAQQTFYGDSTALGDGIVSTWLQVNTDGTPDKIGVTLSEPVLENLPTNFLEFPMELPDIISDSLFTHVLFDWNPGGHPPPGIYSTPHFDVHFYIVPQAERTEVIPGPDYVMPQSQFVAQDYMPDSDPPMVVPNMGAHWVDSTSAEWNGGTFTETLIYGYYKGEMYFLEPMITRAYLLTNPSVVINIKQPEAYQKSGYYPTNYSIAHDPVREEYNVYIHDFVFRSGTTGIAENRQEVPEKISLRQNYPNPFNPSTKIGYQLAKASNVSLTIYNISGQEIKTLVHNYQPAGNYEFEWKGINEFGEQVSSGIYICRLKAGSLVQTRKINLLR